jgi:hypothetical protein
LTEIPFLFGIQIVSTVLYITGKDGLYALDTTAPSQPEMISRLPMTDPSTMRIRDGLAYVGGKQGLTIVDVHDPEQMQVVGMTNPVSALHGAEIFGDFVAAFVGYTDHTELRLIDVANPARPVLRCVYAFSKHVQEAHVSQDHLLVAYQDGDSGLEAMDMRDPRNPVSAALLPAADARGIASSGEILYVASYMDGLKTFRFRPALLRPSPTPTSTPSPVASPTVTPTPAPIERPLSLPWLGRAAH